MSDYERVKKSKLAFKDGTSITQKKKTRKKKPKSILRDKEESYSQKKNQLRKKDIDSLPDYGWTSVETNDDLTGPVMICPLLDDENVHLCITTDEGRGVYLTSLSDEHNPGSIPEPQDVHQVLQLHPIPQLSGAKNAEIPVQTYTIKTAMESYLSCSQYGQISLDSHAVTEKEEWAIVKVGEDGGFALKSVPFGGYLSAVMNTRDLVKSDATFSRKKGLEFLGSLRCDSTNIGDSELFRIFCQRAERKRRLLEKVNAKLEEKKIELNPQIIDEQQTRQYHARPEKYQTPMEYRDRSEYVERLKSAQKRGRLNEELLEKRVKSKSDRYCK